MARRHAKHVVLIVFDYMGYGDIEPFGASEIRTPMLRGMADQGLRYTDCYAPAPICVPSRAALLKALLDTDDRSARFRTAVAFVSPNGSALVASGEVAGTITRQERGDCGFGYDCIFDVGDGLTMAEMGRKAKNAVSHRSRALAGLVAAMNEDDLL